MKVTINIHTDSTTGFRYIGEMSEMTYKNMMMLVAQGICKNPSSMCNIQNKQCPNANGGKEV